MELLIGMSKPYCTAMKSCRNEQTEFCRTCGHNESITADADSFNHFKQKRDENTIPISKECLYCKNNYKHGGDCETKSSSRIKLNFNQPCFNYEFDKRGRVKFGEGWFPFQLFKDLPRLGEWRSDWKMNGYPDKKLIVRFRKFLHLKWDKDRGYLFIYAEYDYMVNDLDGDPLEKIEYVIEKPVLTLIK